VEDIRFVFDAERIKSIFLSRQPVLQSCIDPRAQSTADGQLLQGKISQKYVQWGPFVQEEGNTDLLNSNKYRMNKERST
jgi:hypothetical protein